MDGTRIVTVAVGVALALAWTAAAWGAPVPAAPAPAAPKADPAAPKAGAPAPRTAAPPAKADAPPAKADAPPAKADAPAAKADAPPAKADAPAAKADAPPAKADAPAAPGPSADEVGIEAPTLADPALLAVCPVKVLLVLVLAGAVFYVANWTFLDARFVNTDRAVWGGLVLAGGMTGLAAALLIPLFYMGYPLGVALFAAGAVAYAVHRNGLVTPPLRVLTGAHWARVRRRLSRRRGVEEEAGGPVLGTGRDILFMGLDDLPVRLEGTDLGPAQANREIERILFDAIRRRCSAVGILMRGGKAEVRCRAAGEMRDGGDVERPAADFLMAAVKRLAGLDPAEVRRPQEGRVRAMVAGQSFEIRIKTAGTVRGEQAAIRVTDLATAQMRLEDLGLAEDQLLGLREALSVRPGLVVLSSPRDSGMTTTLHACLRHFDRYVHNVLAFGPHVDLEVENVTHVAVNQEDGPVAAAEIQSRIRMEPDVLAFDSLGVPEVARVLAEQAGEHTVIVGVRAADATQAMERLTALFGSATPLAARLQAVVNQRVIRLLCPDCREAYRPNPEFLRKANLGARRVDVLYRPPTAAPEPGVVCPRCANERYVGRRGLFEVMVLDAPVRDLIRRRAPADDLRTYVRKQGMRNLQEEGLRVVIDGLTSVEEVLRAVRQET